MSDQPVTTRVRTNTLSNNTNNTTTTTNKSSTKGKPSSYLQHFKFVNPNGITYEWVQTSGTGSFGVVHKAMRSDNNQVVAIKRVLQDKRYKNRELQIMQAVSHQNIVQLIDHFYENPKEGVYLNLVLEFVPKTLFQVAQEQTQSKELSLLNIKLYIYQTLRSLAYIHTKGICHRDIKPQNLLVNPETHELKLCDFGSAKILQKGESNVAYICSRYYRAPELIFGAIDYTTAIDVWSTGCVLGELLKGSPLFQGDNAIDQLIAIIRILGTPTHSEILAMNPQYKDTKLPSLPCVPWEEIIPSAPADALDLLRHLVTYRPLDRYTPLQACAHHFFDEIRSESTLLANGKPLPPLFNFSPEEIEVATQDKILDILVPAWYKNMTSGNSNNGV